MKTFYLILFATLFSNTNIKFRNNETTHTKEERLHNQISAIKPILDSNSKYNNKIAFFVDMRIPSGKNRFFVYDLTTNKVLDQALVAHGSGSETGIRGELKFSNEPNSNCTSLGRYSIEKHYKGIFGKAYRLNGLDQTNNNAYKRAIVLHHYSAVPDDQQDYYITNSHGCPMVNEQFFKRIEKLIDNSKKKIILNIYY